MHRELTIAEVARVVKSRSQRMAVSHSGGQYHVYLFEGDTVKGYQRADELDAAIELAVSEPAH